MTVQDRLSNCTLCADRFAATATRHRPKPVVWFRPGARLLICSQAPGMRAHISRKPFDDPSGDRLRDWLGLDRAAFYDKSRIAIVPMGFCFPGYDAAGSDLPPPAICRKTWHVEVLDHVGDVPLKLVVGGYAHKYHLGTKAGVTETVRSWRDHWPSVLPLPHPSWRNTAWIKKNPWFEAEVLPALRARVQEVMA
ncbi:uracil-DNA glycosylase family protein [Marivita geojedonensis]|uniref:Uracil-DNA glycosylase n=1 Tax=Marivita geojedonensis TaxID=1123756 RepID=A0A1X4NQY2_9RHOB|nr:uracil-DNA glycosylase family protein [Marivita geojedonensis]OSQ53228.1 uracil-DNA glycosylase [Marivita geojedonensis]PRY81827.1 uracil-DNA glycosylase [Marivita geojedonensis]